MTMSVMIRRMQAARLLRLLMLLQSRGRQTAPQLAAALEVSTRTVLRDIDALSSSGVPVWGQPGRHGGGFQLEDGWRTQLTGLTEDEAQALLLAGLPEAARDLGLGQAAAGTRLKLLAGLPRSVRAQGERVAQRLHLNPLDWYRAPDTPQHLQAVAAAVWREQRLRVQYESWQGLRQRVLDPLGLVLKAGAWYLVALPAGAKQPRTYRLASVHAVHALEDAAQRPAGFDLPAFWRASSARFEAELHKLPVRLRVSPLGLTRLRNARLPFAQEGEPDGEGWQTLALRMESEDMAARQLLVLGAEAQVLEPLGVRTALQELARGVLARYAVARPVR